jgi:flavin reductase (DIM6/NTAB) family NADH-FMN oxidoreductase RutF
MIDVDPKDITLREVFAHLHGGIAPRPIALVSTLSPDGIHNLAPFSFFNVFGGNPPTVAFSPTRRQRDGKIKDTYFNLVATRECVIQAVTYSIVQQVNLASAEFAPEEDEFVKCGLTPVPSDIVKPPRVAESPFQIECILRQMILLGNGGGSGNLAVCEVVKFHISEEIMTNGQIAPELIDHVGRNGGEYYTRANGPALFTLKRPDDDSVIGYDALPEFVKRSDFFTANDLGQLATCRRIPTLEESVSMVEGLGETEESEDSAAIAEKHDDYADIMRAALKVTLHDQSSAVGIMERAVKCALDQGNADFAWKVIVYAASVSNSETRK